MRLLCLRVLRLGAVNLGKPRVAFRRVALVRIALLQEPAGLIGRAHRGPTAMAIEPVFWYTWAQ